MSSEESHWSRASAAVPLQWSQEFYVASPHDRKYSACLGHLTRNWMQRKKLVTTRTSNTTLFPTEKRNEKSLQVRAVEALAVSTDRALGMGASTWELKFLGIISAGLRITRMNGCHSQSRILKTAHIRSLFPASLVAFQGCIVLVCRVRLSSKYDPLWEDSTLNRQGRGISAYQGK